jgi:hypothetical protein
MIILDVYVVFHCLDYDWYSRLTTRLSKTPINHCGIMVHTPTGEFVYYLTCVDRPWKMVSASHYFKIRPPHSIFYIGSTISQDRKVIDLKEEYIIRPWKILTWFFLTRFIWPFWKPKGCAVFVSKILQSMGFKVRTHVRPLELLRELKNANHYIERQGESWKDLVG